MTLKKIKELGVGGFGVVDLVEDEQGNRFARKTFHFTGPKDLRDNVLYRFRKEAKVQQGLSHRNIVPVIGGDLNADPPYYLMPVAESSLDKDLLADKHLGGHWLAAVSDIVAGLEELHSISIYHRDLKPQNVLRFQDTAGTFYAIGDFGLISRKDTELSSLTVTGMAKNSDHFTAPEIVHDLKQASVQSDIYSLGCILHEMLGKSHRIPCAEIKEGTDHAGIFLGCTRQKPERRFKSARAVLDAVVSIEFTQPEEAQGAEAKDFVSLLQAGSGLDANFWLSLHDYLDQDLDSDRQAVLFAISLDTIHQLIALGDEKLTSSIAVICAQWIRSRSFNFESCDSLANRLVILAANSDLEGKVECLLALLNLGTSHNRWYVERKFVEAVGPGMDEALAKRLSVAFRVEDTTVCKMVSHLEHSISVDRASFHPLLVKTLGEICDAP